MLQCEWESLQSLLTDGLEDLLYEDYAEMENEAGGLPFDLDMDHFRDLERRGIYHVVSARQDGQLVGYNAFFLNHHAWSRRAIISVCDVLYLTPEHRRGLNGFRLLKTTDRLLAEKGVRRNEYGVRLHKRIGSRGGTVGDLLKILGYKCIEERWVKGFA